MFLFVTLANIVAVVLIFSISGPFNDKIDTGRYVREIEAYGGLLDGGGLPQTISAFKPFYGLVGSVLANVVHPYVAILSINLVFLFALTWCTHLFLREMSFDRELATIGTVWVVLAYPVLKYALALGTDVSGWFFAVATAALALRAVRTGRLRTMSIASLVGFLGALSKETAVLGLVFAGFLILFSSGMRPAMKAKWLVALCAPFLALQAVLLALLWVSNAPTFVDAYQLAGRHFASSYFTYFGVQLTGFNVLWLFASAGLAAAVASGEAKTGVWRERYVSLFLAVLPASLWPAAISRILFIQFLLIVPLALIFAGTARSRLGRPAFLALMALPPAVSIALYMVSGDGSLADVLRAAGWI